MSSSPTKLKRDGARISIGLYPDIENSLWRVVRFSDSCVSSLPEGSLRRCFEVRSRVVNLILEEGILAIEQWIDGEIAAGRSVVEVEKVANEGFGFEVVPYVPGEHWTTRKTHQIAAARRRTRESMEVAKLLNEVAAGTFE